MLHAFTEHSLTSAEGVLEVRGIYVFCSCGWRPDLGLGTGQIYQNCMLSFETDKKASTVTNTFRLNFVKH